MVQCDFFGVKAQPTNLIVKVGWALAQQRAQRTFACQMRRCALMLGQGPTYNKLH